MCFRCSLAAVAALITLALPSSAGADVFGPLGEPGVDEPSVLSGPTIEADQPDYAPSSIVTLRGSGWEPGEEVHIFVTDNGIHDPDDPWTHEADVVADEDGNIEDEFQLPPWIVPMYSVTATAESGTATTTFNDAYVNRGCGDTPSVPNPLPVTTTSDTFNGATTTGSCSLREAINAANELETGTVAGQVDVNSISLPSGTYELTITGNDDGTTQGDLDVLNDLTITKSNAGTAIVQGGASMATGIDRVFHVMNIGASADGTDFALNEITVRYGRHTNTGGGGVRFDGGTVAKPITGVFNDSLVTENTLTGSTGGAGIFLANDNVTVTLNDSDVTNNFANCSGCHGGGIRNAGGTVNATDSSIDGNKTRNHGGGIWNTGAGDVNLDNSTVSGNQNLNSDGITNNDGKGGGVYILDPNSTLTVENGSKINNNVTPQDGGGIYVQNGDVTVSDDSEVNGNDAGRDGGGIQANSPDELSFEDSALETNDAGRDGGGFYGTIGNQNQSLSMKRSLVNNNNAGDDGGGVWLDMASTISNTTITNNDAGTDGAIVGTGGGLLARGPDRDVHLYNVTLSHNTADGAGDGIRSGRNGTGDVAVVNLRNTIVANNDGAGTNCSTTAVVLSTAIVNVTNNLDSGSTCGWGTSNNSLSNANADLGALQDNGGPTFTRALGSNSDAIEAASNTVCAAAPVDGVDQRSATRPNPALTDCDIGAYETGPAAPVTTTITVDKDFSDDGPGEVTITLTCESGTVVEDDNTATESDDATFTVNGFTAGDECDASEGSAPAGYSKDESDCQDLVLGTDTSCQIVNTKTVVTTTTITVDKDFSDNGLGEVTITLTCESGTVVEDDNTATESDDATFTVNGFTPGDECDATEGAAPAGYAKNESDCQDLVLGTDTSCQIVNTRSTTITVDKDFSDDGLGEVTITLTCESGTVVEDDNTATESDDATFTVNGFTVGDECDATEGAAPAGYSKDESDCQDLVLGTDTSCQIVNTKSTTTITVDKDFSDNDTGEVTITLTCESGTVVEDDNTATELDDATFTVNGFTPGDECDATEGSAPAGYSKDESDCQDLVLGTDTSCQIVNTKSTTITVDKDFSDNGPGEVTITLTCESGTVVEDDNTATESDDATFTVNGFTAGDECDASEGSAPAGYSKDESDCQDLVLGTDTSCQIVNTKSTTITVDKDFSDNGPGEVTITLTCDSGTVVEDDNTATELDDATFTVNGFTAGDECDATEGSAPAGYTKNESDCQDLVLGTDTSCQIVNTKNAATIEVNKDFDDDNPASVTISLTCSSGVVASSDNTASEADDADFTVTGYTTGATCNASETVVPAGYTQDKTDCQNIAVGSDPSCTIQNVKSMVLLTQGGCSFDRNTSRALRQFPLIYTPEGAASKLTATNPGEFFMNAAYSGPKSSVTIKIPFPFVTNGANPVHVYSGVNVHTAGGKTCYSPDGPSLGHQSNQITWNYATDGFSSTPKTITVPVPASGFVYVRIHLKYGLKGVAGGCTKDNNDPPKATCTTMNGTTRTPSLIIGGSPTIGYQPYTFSFTDVPAGGTTTQAETVESLNVFKKDPGIGGLVLQAPSNTPIENAKVEIWQGTTKKATVYSDVDGWYVWAYKYTGKETTFTVKLITPVAQQQNVTLKSNGWVVANPFTVP